MTLVAERTLRPYFEDPSCVLSLRMMEGAGNTTKDSSGNGNHGTITGATWQSFARFPSATNDKCLYFNGSNQYITIQDFINFTAMTVCLWAYPIVMGGVGSFEQVFHCSGGTGKIQLNWDNSTVGRLYYELKNTASESRNIRYDFGNTLNRWHHIAFTWDGINAIAYGDAKVGTSGGLTGTLAPGTSVYIGGAPADPDSTGYIDEVYVYNRALSADEILAHYNNGRNPPFR